MICKVERHLQAAVHRVNIIMINYRLLHVHVHPVIIFCDHLIHVSYCERVSPLASGRYGNNCTVKQHLSPIFFLYAKLGNTFNIFTGDVHKS